jgi:hypothetical protein
MNMGKLHWLDFVTLENKLIPIKNNDQNTRARVRAPEKSLVHAQKCQLGSKSRR